MMRALALGFSLALAATAASAGPLDVQPNDRVLGNADAPVTVVEYASFTCSHCADFHADVLPQLKARYIDTGLVKLVFRDLPTPPAEVAATAAGLARCAAPERYFDVADTLMTGQAQMLSSQQVMPWYQAAIAVSDRTQAQIETCLADPATLQALRDGQEVAHSLNVNSTPSVFVNGTRVQDTSLAGVTAAIVPLLD